MKTEYIEKDMLQKILQGKSLKVQLYPLLWKDNIRNQTTMRMFMQPCVINNKESLSSLNAIHNG